MEHSPSPRLPLPSLSPKIHRAPAESQPGSASARPLPRAPRHRSRPLAENSGQACGFLHKEKGNGWRRRAAT